MKKSVCILLLNIMSSMTFATEQKNNTSTTTAAAIAACNGLVEKDSCQFNNNNAILDGTCRTTVLQNDNYQLVCKSEPIPKPAIEDATADVNAGKKPHKRH